MIYTKYMLTPGVQWVQADSVMEPEGIYFRPIADRDSAIELALRNAEDGFLGRPAVAMMGYNPESDWEVLVVCYSVQGLIRRVRMMFGIEVEWDGDAPLEFDRGQGIEITQYTTEHGEDVIAFGGLLAGMLAATSDEETRRAEILAARLGVTIEEKSRW